MAPPTLSIEARVSWRGGTVNVEEYAPDHSNMTALQLAMEGGVNLRCEPPFAAALVGGHNERRKDT